MLTKRQKEVLDFISNYTKKKGYAPSLKEIQKRFKLASVSTAHYHVDKLKKGEYLQKEAGHPRAIEVRVNEFISSRPEGVGIESPFLHDLGYDSISIPVVGSANCGPAELLAETNIEGYLKVSKSLVKRKKDGLFVLRAHGNSMNKANIGGKSIKDGHFVIIDSTDRAVRDGDYVLSVIDGAANLKRFRMDARTGERVLVSESTVSYKPIFLHEGDDFMINGKIIAVVRK